MKQLFLFTLMNLFCQNLIAQEKTEFKFEKGSSFLKYTKRNPGLTYLKLNNATENNKSILIFIGFNNDSVKVSNNKNVFLEKKLNYSPQTGISEIKNIENTEDIKVEFFKRISN